MSFFLCLSISYVPSCDQLNSRSVYTSVVICTNVSLVKKRLYLNKLLLASFLCQFGTPVFIQINWFCKQHASHSRLPVQRNASSSSLHSPRSSLLCAVEKLAKTTASFIPNDNAANKLLQSKYQHLSVKNIELIIPQGIRNLIFGI